MSRAQHNEESRSGRVDCTIDCGWCQNTNSGKGPWHRKAAPQVSEQEPLSISALTGKVEAAQQSARTLRAERDTARAQRDAFNRQFAAALNANASHRPQRLASP